LTTGVGYRQWFTINVPDADDFVSLFRSHGLRITPQRHQVFRVLAGNHSHPTAEAVWAAVRREQPAISLKTVYETLHELVKLGAVRRLDLDPGASRFDPNVSTHHHFVCRTCGRMADLEAAAGPQPSFPVAPGYEVESAEVTFWGRCPDCVAAGPGPSAARGGGVRSGDRGTHSTSGRPRSTRGTK
jgi:Fe2+ or Zn2+ uptake regulation protein